MFTGCQNMSPSDQRIGAAAAGGALGGGLGNHVGGGIGAGLGAAVGAGVGSNTKVAVNKLQPRVRLVQVLVRSLVKQS